VVAVLGVRPQERVVITLPDGPGFVDAVTGAMERGAVPLPVNPRLPAVDVAAIVTETDARLVPTSTELIYELTDLEAEPPIPVDRHRGLWPAALRQR
jgi:acyl-CoA synthetase (AMP-forming)/AMP-acid ligase II